MNLRWTDIALWDLDQIYDYVSLDRPDAASSVIARILEAAETLVASPRIGHIGRDTGTRELIVLPWIIVYTFQESTIRIEAILHGSRRF